MHAFPAERMIHPLVLHVIGASEFVLVAHLFVDAHGTRVSVFHIKPTQETYVLVGMYLHNVWKRGVALTGVRLKPCRDVGDGAGPTNGWILDLGRLHLSTSTAAPTLMAFDHHLHVLHRREDNMVAAAGNLEAGVGHKPGLGDGQ